MSTSTGASDVDAAKLRLRTSPTTTASGTQSAQETVRTLNATEAKADKDEKDRKTYGRTPDGTGKYFPDHGRP
jgi:phosphatidylethanolamine N-methyltransferase